MLVWSQFYLGPAVKNVFIFCLKIESLNFVFSWKCFHLLGGCNGWPNACDIFHHCRLFRLLLPHQPHVGRRGHELRRRSRSKQRGKFLTCLKSAQSAVIYGLPFLAKNAIVSLLKNIKHVSKTRLKKVPVYKARRAPTLNTITFPKASPKFPVSYARASPKRPQSVPGATSERPQSVPRAVSKVCNSVHFIQNKSRWLQPRNTSENQNWSIFR